MGRRQKPTPLRLLEGNPGKRRIVPETPPERGPCDPPEHLVPAERDVWLRLAPELVAKGLLAPRYVDTFALFCRSVVAGQRAGAVLGAAGPMISADGLLVANPAGREFRQYAHLARALAADFGMSPAALTAIARASAEAEQAGGPRGPARLLG
jgi:P27 family predicted phage terminase small subunit